MQQSAPENGRKKAEMVAEIVALSSPPPPTGRPSFYESYVFHGIQFQLLQPGVVSASFKVPSRLSDDKGNLSPGALGTIVDVAGGAAVISLGHPPCVTVSMSIQYLAHAEVDDELEIISRLLKYEGGGYANTSISVKNKRSGELICTCQQLCFKKSKSKI